MTLLKRLSIILLITIVVNYTIFIFGSTPSIGILYSSTTEKYYGKSTYDRMVQGAVSILDSGKFNYVIVDSKSATSISQNIKVLIDPSNAALSDDEINLVESYVYNGGKLIAAYESSLKDAQGKNRSNFAYSKFFGVKFVSWDSGKYYFMRPTDVGAGVFGINSYIGFSRGFTFLIEVTQRSVPLAMWYTKDKKIANEKYPVAATLSPSGAYFGENVFLQTADDNLLKTIMINVINYLLSVNSENVNPIEYLKSDLLDKLSSFKDKLKKASNELPKDQLLSIQNQCVEIERLISIASNIDELKIIQSQIEIMEIKLVRIPSVQLRGIWLDSYAIRDSGTPENLRLTIRKLSEMGFNAIFPEVIYKGMSISSKLSHFAQDPVFKEWKEDPLEVIIGEAKKLGMEVHAWCWVFAVATAGKETPIMSAHPDWIEKNKYGGIFSKNNTAWLSHANPEVRKFLLDGLIEVVHKYDVDGINLDYIRYDGDEFGYDDYSVKKFKEEFGIDPFKIEKYSKESVLWQMWREENVNTFVKEFSKRVKTVKDNIIVSADVYPSLSGARMEKKQNWESWVKNRYVDLLIPMNYKSSLEDLRIVLEMQQKYKNDVYICPGLSLISLDSPKKVIDQILLTSEYFKSGFVLFSLSHIKKFPKDYFKALMSEEAVTPFKNISILLSEFEKSLKSTLAVFGSDEVLKPDISVVVSEFEKVKKSYNYTELLNNLSKAIFFISDHVKSHSLALKVIDLFEWMSEIIRPAANKYVLKEEFKPEKPAEMVVIDNVIPLPTIAIKPGTSTLSLKLEEWKDAVATSEFLMYDSGRKSDVKTYVKLMYDKESIYLLFVCEEPDLSSVKVVSGQRDTRTYLGDSVEVFILKDEQKNEYYHFVIGFDGTIYDEIGFDSKWNGDIVASTWKDEHNWYAEMKINLKYIGVDPAVSSEIKMNFCRNRWKGSVPEYSTWSVTYGSFHTPERFGKVLFDKAK